MLRDAGFQQHVAYASQLALAAVFLASFVLKARRPASFVRTIADYRVVPRHARLHTALATGVLATEAALGIAFATGWLVGVALVLGVGLVLVFSTGVTINLRRGRTISCGCFGSDTEVMSAKTIVRLGVLLAVLVGFACAVWLTTARVVTVRDIIDEPRYLADTAAMLVVATLLSIWAANGKNVATVFAALRAPSQT